MRWLAGHKVVQGALGVHDAAHLLAERLYMGLSEELGVSACNMHYLDTVRKVLRETVVSIPRNQRSLLLGSCFCAEERKRLPELFPNLAALGVAHAEEDAAGREGSSRLDNGEVAAPKCALGYVCVCASRM